MKAICIAYPTIMSGLVLRWYADEAGFQAGDEIANAGRECFMTMDGCPDDIAKQADNAHSYLSVRYASYFPPTLDVSRWVTHRHGRMFTRELLPLEGGAT